MPETLTAVRERPIIFSAPMVRAILEDRKHATRRIVKPQPTPPDPSHWYLHPGEGWWTCGNNSGKTWRCPYGKPGDRLWVREAWHKQGGKAPIVYAADEPDFKGKKTSPMRLPRRLSRILLEVTGVRVERVQEIDLADCHAEGVLTRSDYHDLWDSINGPGSWARNDWTWVVSFKRIDAGKDGQCG